MYTLKNTLSGDTISRHFTLRAVLLASSRFQARVRKANGRLAYIPTLITGEDGTPVDPEECWRVASEMIRR